MTRGRQACISCKTRKKKCDRGLPICGYCVQKGLNCMYDGGIHLTRTRAVSGTAIVSQITSTYPRTPTTDVLQIHTPSDTTLVGSLTTAKTNLYHPNSECLDNVYAEVYSIIRSTGQFVDDITARYFQSFHRHLPIISRTRFQNSLIASRAGSGADSAILLLCICLIVSLSTPAGYQGDGALPRSEQRSLYLVTKALLAQVQGSSSPSVQSVQANLLLAIYEYADGRATAAFTSISSCVRMAYFAHLHEKGFPNTNLNPATILEDQEASNTWWGIVTYERAIFCELGGFEQPLLTTLPSDYARLPVEYDILDRGDTLNSAAPPNIAVPCLACSHVGPFGRMAQAICLLDQLIKAFGVSDLGNRLLVLQSLDKAFQGFLASVLPQTQGKAGAYCEPIALAMRGLLLLHGHILDLPQDHITVTLRSINEWKKSSLVALDTATTMVIDIAECHSSRVPTDLLQDTPPCHIYMVQAILKYMQTRPEALDAPWKIDAKDQLRLYIDRLLPTSARIVSRASTEPRP